MLFSSKYIFIIIKVIIYIVPAIFPKALEIKSIIMGFPTATKIAETMAATTITNTYSKVDCPFLFRILVHKLHKNLFIIFITSFLII